MLSLLILSCSPVCFYGMIDYEENPKNQNHSTYVGGVTSTSSSHVDGIYGYNGVKKSDFYMFHLRPFSYDGNTGKIVKYFKDLYFILQNQENIFSHGSEDYWSNLCQKKINQDEHNNDLVKKFLGIGDDKSLRCSVNSKKDFKKCYLHYGGNVEEKKEMESFSLCLCCYNTVVDEYNRCKVEIKEKNPANKASQVIERNLNLHKKGYTYYVQLTIKDNASNGHGGDTLDGDNIISNK